MSDIKSPDGAYHDPNGPSSATSDHFVSPIEEDSSDEEPRRRRSVNSDLTLPPETPVREPGHAPNPFNESQSSRIPEREAHKEVVGSWQMDSRDNNQPISVPRNDQPIPVPRDDEQPIPVPRYDQPIPVSQQPSALREAMYTEAKGAPPSYEAATHHQAGESSRSHRPSTFAAIEPDDGADSLPPRPEDKSAVGQLLAWMPHPPKTNRSAMPRLFQPIIIPQLEVPPTNETVAFARCYSDVLASHEVSQRDFLGFLDGLAVAIAPSSALQGLKVFGVGVSKVPLPFIPLAGQAIKALARTGSGHTSSRARLYLERAKNEYFAPRNLRLSVVKDDELHQRINIPPHTSRLAPLSKNNISDSLCQRRYGALSPYVSPLRFDVPDPDKQVQGVQRLAQKHLEGRLRRDRRKLDNLREKQWIDLSSMQLASWMQRYVALSAEIRSLQDHLAQMMRAPRLMETMDSNIREMAMELSQKQIALQNLIAERHATMGIGGSEAVQAEAEEEGWARRLRWIVIENPYE